eukprot:CAMPEP_0172488244 /NCGR_PEP_ID=MMETSP1066-20121228/17679_1 /TAXON_ID=671091 /ORGANISM="Coscinodiscus wailesii, Strain CCMP2513" /LENGTH=753 /DNA_ID=CAMNT_0013255347 /DNA_START=111 /DNA_END=2372 /DNA_ORIENTATION=+
MIPFDSDEGKKAYDEMKADFSGNCGQPPAVFGFGGLGARVPERFLEKFGPSSYGKYQWVKKLPILEAMPKSPKSTTNKDVYEVEIVKAEANMIGNYKQTVYAFQGKGDVPSVPGKTLEFEADKDFEVIFTNKLVDDDGNWIEHFLRVDQDLHWADPACEHKKCNSDLYDGPIPISIHMHGFNTSEEHEGHPDAWFLPDAKGIDGKYNRHGPMYDQFRQTSSVCEDWAIDSMVSIDTPRRASTRWYHDHTVGITRLNVFMGLVGFAITRGGKYDSTSDRMPSGEFDVPLMISDKTFGSDGEMLFYHWHDDLAVRNWTAPINTNEPYPNPFSGGENFQLPLCGEETCNGLGPSDVPIYWSQNYFGIVQLVNGAAWPVHDVKPGCYRYRLLNAALSRVYDLRLDNGMKFTIVGGDSGLSAKSGIHEVDSLVLSPGERAEILIDFTGYEGTSIILKNDYICNIQQYNNIIGRVMRFDVGNEYGDAQKCPTVNELRTEDILPLQPEEEPGSPYVSDPTKSHDVHIYVENSKSVIANFVPAAGLFGLQEVCGLDVIDDTSYDQNIPSAEAMRLMSLYFLMGTKEGGLAYTDPINNYAELKSVQEWIIINNSNSDHPIHIHALDNFRVVKRDILYLDGSTKLADLAPLPHEGSGSGWTKDTVFSYKQTITYVHTYHDLPGSFIYHCHILGHEDRDMMRPFCILNADGSIPDSCKLKDGAGMKCSKPKKEKMTLRPAGKKSSKSKKEKMALCPKKRKTRNL